MNNQKIIDDILFIDKPEGISSFDVIRKLRKKLGIKKMGHAGTLDPAASGLLIIGVDKGTKKLKKFLDLPKTYTMEVLLGRSTDTGDKEGRVIEEKTVDKEKINKKHIEKILKSMEREIELPIPLYSAVKWKGKPFYEYARKGIPVKLKRRRTRIFYLKLLDIIKNEKVILKIEMKAEKGTYARSVAEEIGKRLNLPAMLWSLRRIKIGNINISQAKQLNEITMRPHESTRIHHPASPIRIEKEIRYRIG